MGYSKIPHFESEDKERLFWSKRDSTQYIDWKKAEKALFPDLKPTTRTISIRLPEHLIEDIKRVAYKFDIPYQSLIKIILAEGIKTVDTK